MRWDCQFCGESFESSEAMSRHLRRKHRNRVKLAILEHPFRPRAEPT